jgi:signal transduction histidine kinase
MSGEEHYQQETLTALLLWTWRIGPIAALLNMIGFLADPAWTTLVGSAGVIVLVLFAWWCLKLVQRGHVLRAARMFVIAGLGIMAIVIFIAAKNEVLLGAMGMGVFIVIATFFEPPRTALRWGIVSSALYEAGLLARMFDASRDLGLRVDIVSLYIVPPVILLFLAFTGRIINQHLTHALRASEAAGRDLARSYAEVELRVAERTHELAAARDQAEAASRAKSAFLANMSHELRTPLTTILGYTGLIEHHERIAADPPLLSDLERINLAGNHLLQLISDVLDLAELEAGDMELHPQPIEIVTLVEQAVREVGPAVAKNNNTLQIRYDQHPGTAQLDGARVQHMLSNLLANAAKFTEHGTITLRVSIKEATTDHRPSTTDHRPPTTERTSTSLAELPVVGRPSSVVIFEVTDTGIGIAPQQLPQLFQPFAHHDDRDGHTYGGAGLGLAVCWRFCRLMGGNLTVSSQPGQGSTFTIYLPAGPSLATATDTTSAVPNSPPAIAADRSG